MERAARSAAACGARRHFDGHTTWTLAVQADTPEHLVEGSHVLAGVACKPEAQR